MGRRRQYTYDDNDGLVCTPLPDNEGIMNTYDPSDKTDIPTPNPDTFVWKVLGAFIIVCLLFTAAIFWVLRPIHIKPDIQEQQKIQDQVPPK